MNSIAISPELSPEDPRSVAVKPAPRPVAAVTGTIGSDVLTGTSGADTLSGGRGDDVYIVNHTGDRVVESANSGTDRIEATVSVALTANVENVVLRETAVTGIGNDASNWISAEYQDVIRNGIKIGVNNDLRGMGGDDVIRSGAGNDRVSGDDGNDTIWAAEGNDLVSGGTGNDKIDGGDGNDVLFGDQGRDLIRGGAGDDKISGGSDADTMAGGAGNDTYWVDSSLDVVTELANEGVDTVVATVSHTLAANVENLMLGGTADISGAGNSLSNVITGNAGDNRLNGMAGADRLVGGKGDDVYYVDNLKDVVVENANEGYDTIISSVEGYKLAAFAEELIVSGSVKSVSGNASSNEMMGNAQNNRMDGGAGNDVLNGGAGQDTLIGGTGNDTFIVNDAGDVVIEAANGGEDTVIASFNYRLSSTVENLVLSGSAVSGVGNNLANKITGNAANNIINGGAGADTMSGGAGNDVYYVDNKGDRIIEAGPGKVARAADATSGTDTVIVSVDNYTLDSGVERMILTDTVTTATGNDANNTISGNALNNVIVAGAGNDSITGGIGDDQLLGQDGDDQLNGGAGNDVMLGFAGNDTMVGGTGHDTYYVDDVGDVVTENANEGTDTVFASVDATLSANVEDLILTEIARIGVGNAAANIVAGNDYDNLLLGLDGNDVVDGGDGADTLTGGTGADTMIGGLGNDLFVVDSDQDVVTEKAGEGTDSVQIGIDYVLAANFENLTLIGSAVLGTGNSAANLILGNDAANALTGLGGDDTLDGGAGADSLVGGTGDDVYVVDNAGDVVTELASEGTELVTSSVTYALSDNVENLTLTGTYAIDGTGNALSNSITGNTAANLLAGGDGNDTINGGAGADTMVGGSGDDIYYVQNAYDVVTELASEGADTINASISYVLADNTEDLVLTGTADIDGTGNAGANVITGNSAANTLDGDAGADTMVGGAGNDTYWVDSALDSVKELANEGVDTVISTVSQVLAANVENLTLGGTATAGTGNDLANLITGNAVNNSLDGGSGADTLVGGLGDDTYTIDNSGDVVTELSDAGTDTVKSSISYTLGGDVENLTLMGMSAISGTGNDLANTVIGNNGSNVLDGGAGADVLLGGLGDDTYYLDVVTDVATELAGEGTDTIVAAFTFDLNSVLNFENLTLTGTAAINATGNSGNNVLTGNTAANTLDGGSGADTLIGGAGSDTYFVDDIGDTVAENAAEGTDNVYASVTYTLADDVENLTLTGTAGLSGTGNGLGNFITGTSAGNILNGLAGNDTLDGGTGSDSMTGGLGDDTYYVDVTADTVTENASEGTDTVYTYVTGYTLAANVENLTLAGFGSISGTGNSGNNVLTGNSGNNSLNGSTGVDTMIGGAGNDSYTVYNTSDVIQEFSNEGTDSVVAVVDYTLSAYVENLTLMQSNSINGTGNDLSNYITGNGGANILSGLGGDDTLKAVGTTDTLIGGIGNDTYIDTGSSTGVSIVENANEGTDTVQIYRSGYTLDANVENLILATGIFIGVVAELSP